MLSSGRGEVVVRVTGEVAQVQGVSKSVKRSERVRLAECLARFTSRHVVQDAFAPSHNLRRSAAAFGDLGSLVD